MSNARDNNGSEMFGNRRVFRAFAGRVEQVSHADASEFMFVNHGSSAWVVADLMKAGKVQAVEVGSAGYLALSRRHLDPNHDLR
jgi:hypothetical protein